MCDRNVSKKGELMEGYSQNATKWTTKLYETGPTLNSETRGIQGLAHSQNNLFLSLVALCAQVVFSETSLRDWVHGNQLAAPLAPGESSVPSL